MTRILHVASFIGNIGDNASHMGFYSILEGLLPHHEIEQLEIRRFYKKYKNADKKYFDASFVDYANTFDLLVIGGGGFLDYWVEGSATGTTIDIDPQLLNNFTVPVLITSVGCIPHQLVPAGNVDKFRRFLDVALGNPRILIAVRNDGSVYSLKDEVGENYLRCISEVADHGFFYKAPSDQSMLVDRPYAAINITNDQLFMHSKTRSDIDVEFYYAELAKVVHHIVSVKKMDVVLVPHIHADLKAISILLDHLDDFLVRSAIRVAPCLQGNNGANFIFGIYAGSKFVIASRYHANVCNLAVAKTTFGLGVLDRVKYLYDQLDLPGNYIDVQKAFSDKLIGLLSQPQTQKNTMAELDKLKSETKKLYAEFFAKQGLV